MNNQQFLNKVKDSFYKYLETGSRSNEKLKILHGSIAQDIIERLGSNYKIHSLGYGDNREVDMLGRYMEKKVDIGIEKNEEIVAGLALKFIMSNYSQNSNNYFENMLGETANVRTTGKPYFQIVILPSKVPYFKEDGTISKIETITNRRLLKYINLSNDNINNYMHTPNKTLIYLIDIPIPDTVSNKEEYIEYYINNDNLFVMENEDEAYGFGSAVIYNNYDEFIDKVCHYIKSM